MYPGRSRTHPRRSQRRHGPPYHAHPLVLLLEHPEGAARCRVTPPDQAAPAALGPPGSQRGVASAPTPRTRHGGRCHGQRHRLDAGPGRAPGDPLLRPPGARRGLDLPLVRRPGAARPPRRDAAAGRRRASRRRGVDRHRRAARLRAGLPRDAGRRRRRLPGGLAADVPGRPLRRARRAGPHRGAAAARPDRPRPPRDVAGRRRPGRRRHAGAHRRGCRGAARGSAGAGARVRPAAAPVHLRVERQPEGRARQPGEPRREREQHPDLAGSHRRRRRGVLAADVPRHGAGRHPSRLVRRPGGPLDDVARRLRPVAAAVDRAVRPPRRDGHGLPQLRLRPGRQEGVARRPRGHGLLPVAGRRQRRRARRPEGHRGVRAPPRPARLPVDDLHAELRHGRGDPRRVRHPSRHPVPDGPPRRQPPSGRSGRGPAERDPRRAPAADRRLAVVVREPAARRLRRRRRRAGPPASRGPLRRAARARPRRRAGLRRARARRVRRTSPPRACTAATAASSSTARCTSSAGSARA